MAIKSVEVDKYVSSNTDQDITGINAVANRDSAGAWELFTVEMGEVRHYTYDNSQDKLYDDNDKISDWARYDVYHMKSIKVMNGVGDNLFAPKDCYSREQSIVTFVRLLNCGSH